MANDDSKYGYYIPEDIEYSLDGYPNSSIISKSSIDCIIFNYQGNEFEEEDKYHDYWLDKKLTEKGYSTKFGKYLVNLKMIENKKEKLNKISKSRTLTTINK